MGQLVRRLVYESINQMRNRNKLGEFIRGHKVNLIHGHCQQRTSEYNTWIEAKARCFNPRHRKYESYGGRGISMCEEWQSDFLAFYRDLGSRPTGLSLDRKDNDGDYKPGNCRWATRKEQARTTRLSIKTDAILHVKRLLANSNLSQREIAKIIGIAHSTVSRIKRGKLD